MAKIENTTVYPTVTPTAEDLLIGTDVSNENNTVTFKISSLTTSSTLQGLQSVLDTGNSATQTMQLTGSISLLGGVNTGFIDLCQIKLGGNYGTAGQVLTSQGSGSCATWQTPAAASCCNLADTLTAGNSATNNMTLSGLGTFAGAGGGVSITTGGTLFTEASVVSTFEGDVSVFGTTLNFGTNTTLNDSTGSTGTTGAVLTVGATGYPVWGTLPVPSTPNLQQVLTVGNTATGVGIQLTATSPLSLDATSNIVSAGTNTFSGNNTFSANGTTLSTAGISLTGTLYAGASVGTPGQVLTSTGSGVQWSSSAGVTTVDLLAPTASTGLPLTISPTSGDVKITPHTYNGTSNVGYVPAGGTAGTFLQGDGTWGTVSLQNLSSVLSQGNTAANSITLTGASNSITAYKGVFTAIQDSTGSTGAASNVIVADGAGGWAWGTPASGAVTSVSSAPVAPSTGLPLVISPTSGAVTVSSRAYAGTTNVGHVPAGGSATTFLRGDGTWVTPTASTTTDSLVITQRFTGNIAYTSGGPYTFTGIDQGGFTLPQLISNPLPNAPGAGAFTPIDHMSGFFFQNPNIGSCTSAIDDLAICSIQVSFLGSSVFGTHQVDIYSADPCNPESAFTLVGGCTFEVESAIIYCCNMTLRDTNLAAGQGLFLAVTPPTTELNNAFMGRINIKFTSN